MKSTVPVLSAIVIPHNEASKIEQCLRALTWADEIIVVDLESTDDTVAICRRYTDIVVSHPWAPFADPIRNYAISLANGNWILLLDADEYVSEKLSASIQRLLSEDPPVDVYTIERNHIRFGRVLHQSEAQFPEAAPRLFRRGVLNWPGVVHSLPSLDGLRVVHLHGSEYGVVAHDTWPLVDDMLDRLVRYTRLDAIDRYKGGERYTTSATLVRAVGEFGAIFFRQRAYRDGVPGLFYALSMAIYRIVVAMQLWQHQGSNETADSGVRRIGWILALPVRAALSLRGFVTMGTGTARRLFGRKDRVSL